MKLNWWNNKKTTSTSYNNNDHISSCSESATLLQQQRTIVETDSYHDDDNVGIGSSRYRTGSISSKTNSNIQNNNNNHNNKKLRLINRVLLVCFILAVLTMGIVYIQKEMNDLYEKIQSDHRMIDHLNEIIIQHESVIERFNSSVSNQDVLVQLNKIQESINITQSTIEESLQKTQNDINKQLQATTTQLQNTVDDAERIIQEQVVQVKKDVEQYVIQTEAQFSLENSFMVYQLAGTFTVLSCLISMWHMTAHIRKFNQPDVQRKILAILWMSPIYAITSWFSLVFPSAEQYLAIIKDGYEGYIIYTFLSFCIAVIGKGERTIVVNTLAEHAHHLSPPFRIFGCLDICGCTKPILYDNNRALADAILLQCQSYAMQFVFFRPVTTALLAMLKKMNYYGLSPDDDHSVILFGWINLTSPQFYIVVVQNISIFIAFTGLLKFYHAVDEELAWCRPFAKFLCIKGVVFMTFWQGLAISVLAKTTGVVVDDGTGTGTATGSSSSSSSIDGGGVVPEHKADEWAKGAQNFLICLEMLLFSIAHFYCFPVDEWEDGYRVRHYRANFTDTVALGDFVSDLKLLLTSSSSSSSSSNKGGISNKKLKYSKKLLLQHHQQQQQLQETIPEVDNEDTNSDAVTIMSSSSMDDEESNNSTPCAGPKALMSPNKSNGSSLSSSSLSPVKYRNRYGKNNRKISNEEQVRIATALENSLGSILNDPEIAEAKERLLASRILSPEYFDYSDDDDDDDNEDNEDNNNDCYNPKTKQEQIKMKSKKNCFNTNNVTEIDTNPIIDETATEKEVENTVKDESIGTSTGTSNNNNNSNKYNKSNNIPETYDDPSLVSIPNYSLPLTIKSPPPSEPPPPPPVDDDDDVDVEAGRHHSNGYDVPHADSSLLLVGDNTDVIYPAVDRISELSLDTSEKSTYTGTPIVQSPKRSVSETPLRNSSSLSSSSSSTPIHEGSIVHEGTPFIEVISPSLLKHS